MKQQLRLKTDLQLESGAILKRPNITYHSYGALNADASNVIWVCHALTANSDVFDWWAGLFGPDALFNPEEHFIICANMLGSHYGTEGPLSANPSTKEPYYHDFPDITVRDMVSLHKALADNLGIDKIALLIGGSMGGQQSLEWAIQEPTRFENLSLIATNALHSPWAVAFNESQRMAIEADPSWKEHSHTAGLQGMKVARSIALLSYRNFRAYAKTQEATDKDAIFPDRAGSYQRYQGEKLARRFNPFSYWYLSRAMDSHNVGRNRGGIAKALSKIRARTVVISLNEDVLFPLSDQEVLQRGIKGAKLVQIPSDYGHDGFLIEVSKLTTVLARFLEGQSLLRNSAKEGRKGQTM